MHTDTHKPTHKILNYTKVHSGLYCSHGNIHKTHTHSHTHILCDNKHNIAYLVQHPWQAIKVLSCVPDILTSVLPLCPSK